MDVYDHRKFVTEGLRRQVEAGERTALAADRMAKSVDTIKTLMIVWFILSLLGAAITVVAARS